MLYNDPFAVLMTLSQATPSQRLGAVLYFGGAAMVMLSLIMHTVKAARKA